MPPSPPSIRLVDGDAPHYAASPAHLRAMFELTTDIELILRGERDAEGNFDIWRYIDANESALQFFDCTRESLVGRCVQEIFPGRAERAKALCDRALTGGERLQYETELLGRHVWIRMFAIDEECVAFICTDITDRKQAELGLARSERRFHALLEQCPVGVAQNSLEGRFEYANAGFCSIVGYSPEELYRTTWQQITHPEDIGADLDHAERVLSGQLPYSIVEKRYIRKDGQPVWVSVFGNYILDEGGRPVQSAAVVVDISARKLADLALHESRQRLLLAHDAAGLGSFDWNIVADTANWDSRARALWGLPSGAALNLDAALGGIHAEDRSGVHTALERALDPAGDGRYFATFRVVNATDGNTRWVESHGQVVFEKKAAVRMVGTLLDVTERVTAEQALRLADQRKDQFLAMLAHELRNPVAPIMNVATLLATRWRDDPQSAQLLGIVQRQTRNLARLLDDLLDVARINRNRIELRLEVADLHECVRMAHETVEPALRSRRHEVQMDRSRLPLLVNLDPVRITQCLTNVLNNAVKYSPEGSMICIATFERDGSAVVQIRDTGEGIAPELLPHVFDLFAQAARPLSRNSGGLGIGLSVCKRLLEMHGGQIEAHSDGPGRGSTFTLTLPLVQPGADAAIAGAESP